MAERLAKKVLLIGWDAADWRMIEPLLDAGAMPTLASLLERGTRGNLATIQPILSPMLWTSIATGKRADKHGICGFIEPMPDNSGVRPVTSTSRTCKALWNILSQSGMTSHVVSWFASHPAEPIRGVVVSDRYAAAAKFGGAHAPLPDGTVHPPELAEPLRELLVDPAGLDAQALLPFIPRAAEIDQESDPRLAKLAGLLARTASVQAAACRVVSQPGWDLACVYFDGIDQFGHTFMPYHPPRLEGISERDAELYGEVMNGCYRFHDMMLEALLAAAGPDTTVLLVSDHGFYHDRRRPGTDGFDQPEAWHRPFGVACMAGPGVRQGERLYGATLLDVTPTVLALLGLPGGADMDGRAWMEVLDPPTKLERIMSWDALPGDDGRHDAERREDPVSAAEAMRQLIDLGYVDPPGEDVQANIDKTVRDLRTNLALALSDSARAERAVPMWEQLVAEHPDEPAYRVEMARCLYRLQRHEEADRCLDGLAPHLREAPRVRMMRGSALLKRGEPCEALAFLEPLAEALPQSAAVWSQLGQAYLRLDELDRAERALAEARALDEENALVFDGLAELALRRGQAEAAVEHALKAVGLTHHFARAHYHLGCGLTALGMHEQAEQALQTCLGIAPSFRPAHERIAQLRRRRGARPDDAVGVTHELLSRPNHTGR